MEAAIVTTLKNPGISLLSFIKYHLTIGFSHIFLFFDDSNDDSIELVKNMSKISVIKNDSHLKNLWLKTKIYKLEKEKHEYIDKEVMARQVLNVEVANNMALEMGIDWLLHIDADELFFTSSNSVEQHFSQLTRLGIKSMMYVNHEAVPEKLEIHDYFKEVNLFRRNPRTLVRNQINILSMIGDNFRFYSTGKSSGYVDMDLSPYDVHKFNNHINSNITDDPCILHYSVCGIDNFINKYKTLGYFPDYWFGYYNIYEMIPFHIESRNIVNSETYTNIEKFYKERIIIDKFSKNFYIENNILFRNSTPQYILGTDLDKQNI